MHGNYSIQQLVPKQSDMHNQLQEKQLTMHKRLKDNAYLPKQLTKQSLTQ